MKKMVKTLACVLTTAALLFAVTGCPKTTDDTPEETTNHYLKFTIDETATTEGSNKLKSEHKPIIHIATSNGTDSTTAKKVKSVSYKVFVPTTNASFLKFAVSGKHLYENDGTWFDNNNGTYTTATNTSEWNAYVKYDENNDAPTAGEWVTKTQDFETVADVHGYSDIDGTWCSGTDALKVVTSALLDQKWRQVSLEGYSGTVAASTESIYIDDVVITYTDDSKDSYDMETTSVPEAFTTDSETEVNVSDYTKATNNNTLSIEEEK